MKCFVSLELVTGDVLGAEILLMLRSFVGGVDGTDDEHRCSLNLLKISKFYIFFKVFSLVILY